MTIHSQTVLKVIDNSGAAYIKCIGVLRKQKAPAVVGDIIVGSVRHTRQLADTSVNSRVQRVTRGEVVRAVVVRTRKDYKRVQEADGTYVRFDDNACVLVDVDKRKGTVVPRGTRITGAVAQELRARGMTKILSLAPAVV